MAAIYAEEQLQRQDPISDLIQEPANMGATEQFTSNFPPFRTRPKQSKYGPSARLCSSRIPVRLPFCTQRLRMESHHINNATYGFQNGRRETAINDDREKISDA
jgi:hypothetical protein